MERKQGKMLKNLLKLFLKTTNVRAIFFSLVFHGRLMRIRRKLQSHMLMKVVVSSGKCGGVQSEMTGFD